MLSEKFLNSVSAFIRRCFEYADPDHPQNRDQSASKGDATVAQDLQKFSIGDDEDEEDLLDLSDSKAETQGAKAGAEQAATEIKFGRALSSDNASKQSANVALDPANPLHITLPTFRMVILADELLQQFFEFSFAESFHIAPASMGRTSSSFSIQTPSLTTFSNINSRQSIPSQAPAVSSHAPSKGLRGLLDNIVTDGMRVATEVRKRMDEAQKDLERSALSRDEEEDEEEDEESKTAGLYTGDSDQRSVREADRDLLDGADIGSLKENEGIIAPTTMPSKLTQESSNAGEKIIEFES
jgi:hypothetical protein